MSKIKNKDKKDGPYLKKQIRNELRLLCALRAYSQMKEGDGITVRAQWKLLQEMYHGKKDVRPSQIEMLVKGVSCYKNLYTSEPVIVLNKKDNKKDELYLRKDIVLDTSQNYIAGRDIVLSDMEKMFKNSEDLVTGRQLYDQAKKGAAFFRKALIYTQHKWDIQKMQPIKSGTTIDNVIFYVRCKMYKEMDGPETKAKEIVLAEAKEDSELLAAKDKYNKDSTNVPEKDKNVF